MARRDPRRRWPLPVAVATLAVVVGALVFARSDDPPDLSEPLPEHSVVSSYRLTVSVDTPGAPPSREVLAVRRPFHGRFTVESAGQVTAATLSNADGLFTRSGGTNPGWTLVEPGIRRAAGDNDLLAALGEALRRGQATFLGTDRVAGRPCWDVRVSDPIAEDLELPTARDHTDICVDKTGIGLRERWTIGGQLVRTRTAENVELSLEIPDAEFEPDLVREQSVEEQARLPRLDVVTDEQRSLLPVQFRAPEGHRHHSTVVRYGPTGDVTTVGRYLRGTSLLELELRDRSDGEAITGAPETIAGIGEARFRLRLGTSDLTVLAGGQTARLRSPDPGVLREAAGGLRRRR